MLALMQLPREPLNRFHRHLSRALRTDPHATSGASERAAFAHFQYTDTFPSWPRVSSRDSQFVLYSSHRTTGNHARSDVEALPLFCGGAGNSGTVYWMLWHTGKRVMALCM